ncbi:hypothetical protein [Pseudonocardia xishanensis]|uniref:MFS transporter n=1 Tax=Pseudonocardia xishanensis TaxID=630995 RepID=A0ABP8RUP0_9PSEU
MIAAAGLVVGGGLLVFLPAVSQPYLAVALVSVGYGPGALCLPLLYAAVSMIAPDGMQSTVLGILVALQALSGLIAPALTGLLVENADTPAAGFASAFQICEFAALVGGLVVAAVVRPERDRDAVHAAALTG